MSIESLLQAKKTIDELIVQAEYTKGVDPGTVPQLKTRLEAELKAKGLRSVVQMVEPDRLERTEFKGKRVIDKRSLYDQITQQK